MDAPQLLPIEKRFECVNERGNIGLRERRGFAEPRQVRGDDIALPDQARDDRRPNPSLTTDSVQQE